MKPLPSTKLDSQWSLGENYNNMGKQYYFGEQYSKALEALEKAYEYAHSIGARELICDNYEYSSWVYAAIGNYNQAFKCLSQMSALSKNSKAAINCAILNRKSLTKGIKTKNMLPRYRNKSTR